MTVVVFGVLRWMKELAWLTQCVLGWLRVEEIIATRGRGVEEMQVDQTGEEEVQGGPTLSFWRRPETHLFSAQRPREPPFFLLQS